jgi:hypothetical protein
VLHYVIFSSLLLSTLFSNITLFSPRTYYSHCNINQYWLVSQRYYSIRTTSTYRTADILILGSWLGWRPDTVASRNCSIIGGDIKCAYRLPTHKQRPSKKGGSEKITCTIIQNYYSNVPAVEHANLDNWTCIIYGWGLFITVRTGRHLKNEILNPYLQKF